MNLPATYPSHIRSFVSNVSEVRQLLNMHTALTGRGPGRRRNVEILNKSGVVMLVACWEAYVEELATQAFDSMMASATDPKVFPNVVLAAAARPLREAPDETKVWSLAGDGWREVLTARRQETLSRHVGKLNTPRPSNIDDLFEKLVGLKSMSQKWVWNGCAQGRAVTRLEALVTLRGEIAHKVKATTAVRKRYVEDASLFLSRLAAVSSNVARAHVHARTGTYPWVGVSYGAVA